LSAYCRATKTRLFFQFFPSCFGRWGDGGEHRSGGGAFNSFLAASVGCFHSCGNQKKAFNSFLAASRCPTRLRSRTRSSSTFNSFLAAS